MYKPNLTFLRHAMYLRCVQHQTEPGKVENVQLIIDEETDSDLLKCPICQADMVEFSSLRLESIDQHILVHVPAWNSVVNMIFPHKKISLISLGRDQMLMFIGFPQTSSDSKSLYLNFLGMGVEIVHGVSLNLEVRSKCVIELAKFWRNRLSPVSELRVLQLMAMHLDFTSMQLCILTTGDDWPIRECRKLGLSCGIINSMTSRKESENMRRDLSVVIYFLTKGAFINSTGEILLDWRDGKKSEILVAKMITRERSFRSTPLLKENYRARCLEMNGDTANYELLGSKMDDYYNVNRQWIEKVQTIPVGKNSNHKVQLYLNIENSFDSFNNEYASKEHVKVRIDTEEGRLLWTREGRDLMQDYYTAFRSIVCRMNDIKNVFPMHNPERHLKTLICIAESVSKFFGRAGKCVVSSDCVAYAASLGELMLTNRYGLSVYTEHQDSSVFFYDLLEKRENSRDLNLMSSSYLSSNICSEQEEQGVPPSPCKSFVTLGKNERDSTSDKKTQFAEKVVTIGRTLGISN